MTKGEFFMRLTRRTALAAPFAASLAAPGIARAQAPIELSVQYSIPQLFNGLMQQVAESFNAKHPNIKVSYRAAAENYEEIMQRHLRDAVTRNLPDVGFHGLNRQRTLLERNIPVDLRPIMASDPETATLGFLPSLLSMGQVGEVQTGIGFALSTPVLYFNLDLVRRAGGDPERLPETWAQVIELARAIDTPAENVRGMFYNWQITGNWAWQAAVFSHGGTMLNADESEVAFTAEPGQRSIRLLREFVEKANMPDIRADAMTLDFLAGRMGIVMNSTADIGRFNREIGGRFQYRTARYPLSSPQGRLPAGGNVAMVFARDPARQKAAWEFVKFACGPEGATMMVKHTGYMPATSIPAAREDMLAPFYRENPNNLTAIRQQPVMTGWYAFPGQNALKITDVIYDHLQSVVAKRAEPDAALAAMGRDVQALLPRRRG
jgi:multiple sugar transport system substrate-binding protein